MKALSQLLSLFLLSFAAKANSIQIGDIYSKIPWRKAYQDNALPFIQEHIENTVLINTPTGRGVGRGTGFYIGLHQGRHLFLTNAHVLTTHECRGTIITFLKTSLAQGRAECERVLVSRFNREESDMTLFTIKASQLKDFAGKGLELELEFSPRAGQMLMQYGFGIKSLPRFRDADQAQREFSGQANIDSDCAVISPTGVLQTVPDMSGKLVHHNISIGCDVTGGDSGSAIVDRETGRVVALLWASGINPRDRDRIKSVDLWSHVIGSDDSRIWENFAFAISIKELSAYIKPYL